MKIQTWVLTISLCSGCGAEGLDPEAGLNQAGQQQSALSNKDFDVGFTGCTEFAGIGFVPAENARPLVPEPYALAGDAQSAIAVVRVASCQDAIVDGKSVGPTRTSQIGIMLAGGDATADINNYTVAYVTNQARLHARLQGAGLTTDKSDAIRLLLAGTTLTATSTNFQITGSAAVPTSAPTTFVASWWADGRHGTVQSRTVFPDIRFGSASTTLTTPSSSELGALLDATTLTFPILDSYNAFATAHLEVRISD
ncbi:MAG: hypothetical protein EOO73_25415 [Myxococcales bacterium]|nr:MAG: hypothetical protein EOO73_25415 [Myxococcales bacterium]